MMCIEAGARSPKGWKATLKKWGGCSGQTAGRESPQISKGQKESEYISMGIYVYFMNLNSIYMRMRDFWILRCLAYF